MKLSLFLLFLFSFNAQSTSVLEIAQEEMITRIKDCSMFYAYHQEDAIASECHKMMEKAVGLNVPINKITKAVENGLCIAERDCTAATSESISFLLRPVKTEQK